MLTIAALQEQAYGLAIKKELTVYLSHQPDMFKHYFKISLRQLLKQRFYALINILGLAIGIACCIVVLLFVYDETSYDTYHVDADRLYRLSIQRVEMSSGDESLTANTPILWGPALAKDYPEVTFSYNFLDETFREQYESEQSLGRVFSYISFLAIFIACLGLLGLAAFTTNRRIKEIGIRKTLGASVSDIVVLLSKDFTKLVIIAVLLAVPLSIWATEQWLELFAYRISSNVVTYIVASVIAVAIAWLTISFQTIRAARSNPVESLQSE